jgi:hypothetical protein
MFINIIKKNNYLKKNYYSLNILNYQTLFLTCFNNLLNFWKNKKKNLKFSFTFKDSCNSELLIQSAKNNIRIILSTLKIPDPIYKVHISTLNNYKYIKKFLSIFFVFLVIILLFFMFYNYFDLHLIDFVHADVLPQNNGVDVDNNDIKHKTEVIQNKNIDTNITEDYWILARRLAIFYTVVSVIIIILKITNI